MRHNNKKSTDLETDIFINSLILYELLTQLYDGMYDGKPSLTPCRSDRFGTHQSISTSLLYIRYVASRTKCIMTRHNSLSSISVMSCLRLVLLAHHWLYLLLFIKIVCFTAHCLMTRESVIT
jgi:hypothetical protein